MKHTTSRMLFGYWDALRGERAAPERADLEPGAMRHVLADAFILACEGERRHAAFRLAGTRVRALFGRDLKDVALRDLWPADARVDADGLVRLCQEDTVGLVAGLLGTNDNGSELALEMLLLPLRHGGRTDARLLGALSPAALPSWAGLVPLRRLEIRSLRVVQPERPPLPDAGRAPIGRRRTLLVVHEGGRT